MAAFSLPPDHRFVVLNVRLAGLGEQPTPYKTKSVGLDSLFIATFRPLDALSPVTVWLELTDGPIEVMGIVEQVISQEHSIAARKDPGMLIRFELDPDQEQLFAAILDAHDGGDEEPPAPVTLDGDALESLIEEAGLTELDPQPLEDNPRTLDPEMLEPLVQILDESETDDSNGSMNPFDMMEDWDELVDDDPSVGRPSAEERLGTLKTVVKRLQLATPQQVLGVHIEEGEEAIETACTNLIGRFDPTLYADMDQAVIEPLLQHVRGKLTQSRDTMLQILQEEDDELSADLVFDDDVSEPE